MHYDSPTTAVCPTCQTRFAHLDRNEDGAPELPVASRCRHPGCEARFCGPECDPWSFLCECGRRFCRTHAVDLFGMKLCLPCAVQAMEDEPACARRRSDVDLFDASDCEVHNPESSWNRARRSLRRAA